MKTRLLSRQEAAERLGVSLRTLDGMVQRGVLPAYRIGPKIVRLKETDLEAYLERHLVVPEKSKSRENPGQRLCAYVPGMKVV